MYKIKKQYCSLAPISPRNSRLKKSRLKKSGLQKSRLQNSRPQEGPDPDPAMVYPEKGLQRKKGLTRKKIAERGDSLRAVPQRAHPNGADPKR